VRRELIQPAPGEPGGQLLPDLFYVSWLGMTPGKIDCHVFILRGKPGLLLIDCGTPWGHEQMVRNMAHWGLKPEDVRTILLTHGHVDHVTGGYLFQRRGVEILGHREIGALAADGQTCRLDGSLADGDRLSRCGFDIEVIGTPGHTRGCLSFLIKVNGARCLFSGDVIMHDGRPGWTGDPGYNAADIVASLKRLLRVDFQHVCFGHGAIMDDRGQLFREALAQAARNDWERPTATT